MTKSQVVIQPGPAFWEVFAGAIRAQGPGVTKWAAERGFAVASLKPMATGGTNGEKSKAVRQEMLDAIGEDTFRSLYEARLRHEGLV